ncbi:Nucleic acid-binding, OB-fold protein [Sarocladium implicatum]|nr:Nucleic acid-binding, OB-fold protein [Sarocladium implicatum]
MPAKILLFAGAPPSSAVTESSCTLETYLPQFTHFLDIPETEPDQVPSSFQHVAAWRSLPLKRLPLHTGLTQQHSLLNEDVPRHANFFSTADVSFDDSRESLDDYGGNDALSQFYEASLSALENTSLLSEGESFDASFMTTSSTGDYSRISQNQDKAPIAAHLSDLEDVPPAPRILALNPSTVTLNLIVGILSIAQPRTVTTRWGRAMSLIEILVGDDTRSGFAVTFWLPESEVTNSHITKLRRQDVVLLQNVGLHVFRGKVYGQSLRRDLTKVSILWGSSGQGIYSTRALAKAGPSQPQMEKARLVKDWVLKFVGADKKAQRTSKRRLRSWDEPPPDSQ